MNKTIKNKRTAYFLQDHIKDKNGNYIPCIAVEGVEGYKLTDLNWGKDLEIAAMYAKVENDKLGLTGEDVAMIVHSTMKFTEQAPRPN